ncbi:hypothetical protein OIU76_028897, partial [Salix suchowensis]
MVDPFRQGFITEGDVGYRQTVVLRSYEVGGDKTATLESILNLLQASYLTETFFVKNTDSILKHLNLNLAMMQETALNHAWVSGLLGDGFGATHGM